MWVKGRAPCGVLGQRPDWVALGAVRPLQGEALAQGRRKSLDEMQKEVNQFLEKWHRKPHKAVEKDWDRGDDLEL